MFLAVDFVIVCQQILISNRCVLLSMQTNYFNIDFVNVLEIDIDLDQFKMVRPHHQFETSSTKCK